MSGNITNGISSLSTSELALTPTPNAKPSCQLLVLMHVPSSQQTSIVPETHLHKKVRKKRCVLNKTFDINDVRSLAEFL